MQRGPSSAPAWPSPAHSRTSHFPPCPCPALLPPSGDTGGSPSRWVSVFPELVASGTPRAYNLRTATVQVPRFWRLRSKDATCATLVCWAGHGLPVHTALWSCSVLATGAGVSSAQMPSVAALGASHGWPAVHLQLPPRVEPMAPEVGGGTPRSPPLAFFQEGPREEAVSLGPQGCLHQGRGCTSWLLPFKVADWSRGRLSQTQS